MKKSILFSALMILTTGIMAQQMVIKPTLGMNFTDFSKDQASGTYTAQIGYQIGGSISFGTKFYIEPGVFYARKNTDFASTTPGINANIKYAISGVRIPVAVGYSIIGGGDTKTPIGVRIFAGGSAFILTSVSQGEKSEYNSVDWGVFAGAGLDIGIIFLDLKYEWSLTNIENDASSTDPGKAETIYINLGVRIPIAK